MSLNLLRLMLLLVAQILLNLSTIAQSSILDKIQAQYEERNYEQVLSEINKWKSSATVDSSALLFAKLSGYEAASHGMMNQFDISIPKTRIAIELLEKHDSTEAIIAELYDDIVVDYRLSGDFENAKKAGRDLVNYCREHLDTLSIDYAAYLVRSSYPYMSFDQEDKGDSIVDVGLEVFLAINAEMHPDINMAYNVKGVYNKNRGDYAASARWFSKAKKVLEFNDMDESDHYVTILHNMSNVQRLTGELDTAIHYLMIAKELNEKIYGKGTFENESVFTALSNCYILKEVYETGINYGRLSLEANEKLYGKESTSYIHNELAFRENLLIAGMNEEAIAGHEDLGRRTLARYGDQAETYSYYVRQVGKALKNIGKYDEAIPQLLSSLTDFGIDPENIQESFRIKEPASFMSVMSEVGDAYYRKWKLTEDIENIYNAEKYTDLGIQYIQELRKQSVLSESKLFFTSSQSEFIEQAIQIQYELYNETNDIAYVAKGLQYIEMSKNILFTENLKSRDILNSNLIPKEELLVAQQLREDVEKVKTILYECESDSLQLIAENQLYDLSEREAQWFASIDEKYPAFKNRHYGNWEKGLNEIRTSFLSDGELILDYLQIDEGYYVVGISKGQHSFREISESELPRIEFFKDTKGVNQDQLRQLSKILLHPEVKKHSNVERITIMPSGPLTFVPFEAMVLGDGSMAISKYSFRQLINFESSIDQEDIRTQVLAVAPEYDQDWIEEDDEVYASLLRAGQWKLPGAQKESKAIIDLLGGKLISGVNATKNNFINIAPDYGVLHLSMHTLPSEDQVMNSTLVFSGSGEKDTEEQLSLEEIYNLNLNAQMVTLSACNTGTGEYKKGEGIMSIAHAFGIAGVPSTVMSLWKVPDESTSEIMIAYYNYLKEGLSKDRALQRAKLDYLDNTVSEKQKDPFYWAGFVVVGDISPIHFYSTTSWYMWGVLGVVLLGGLGLYKSSSNRKALAA